MEVVRSWDGNSVQGGCPTRVPVRGFCRVEKHASNFGKPGVQLEGHPFLNVPAGGGEIEVEVPADEDRSVKVDEANKLIENCLPLVRREINDEKVRDGRGGRSTTNGNALNTTGN